MSVGRRSFLRHSVLSASLFGFDLPRVFAASERPESGGEQPGSVDSVLPGTAETDAIRAQIEANNRSVGHAIVTSDFAALEKLWAPVMQVNSPGNNILTREQVFTAMREDKLRYTSAKAVPEAFFVSKDIAIEMGHDDIVMANGPMAGKPLTRRFTNVWQKSGDGWMQIARQATYVGVDGGAVYGHPDPTLHP